MQRSARVLLFAGAFFASICLAQVSPISGFTVTRFVVEGDNPLSERETEVTLAPFVGELHDFKDLRAASQALQERLYERGYRSHRVIIPEQTLHDGIVKLRVIAFRVGDIQVEGNKYFSTANILSSLPALEQGKSPDTNALSRQLMLANDNPAKSLDVTFREGDQPRSIDALVAVQDYRPASVFASFNNYSSIDTPNTRLIAGLQHSNLFNLDHVLTATATRSPGHWSDVKQYGADYRIPLYRLSGDVNIYYIYSDVDSGRVAGDFDVSGKGRFFGAGYKQRLTRVGTYSHTAAIKIEDNLFENETRFAGTPIGTDVRSRPISLRYDGDYRFRNGITGFYITYEHNLSGGSDNNDKAYTANRFGASKDWDAWQFGSTLHYLIARGWYLDGRLEVQYSNDPLIPGEQFGVGGAYSVRGYHERIVAGDSGVAASVEVWTPSLWYGVHAIGFVDGGHTWINDRLPGETGSEDLYSVGAGLRWFWRRYLSLQLDVAQTLSDAGEDDAGTTRVLFNVVARY
jgi:hemolysin activation/secretion protein